MMCKVSYYKKNKKRLKELSDVMKSQLWRQRLSFKSIEIENSIFEEVLQEFVTHPPTKFEKIYIGEVDENSKLWKIEEIISFREKYNDSNSLVYYVSIF